MKLRNLALKCGAVEQGDIVDSDYSIEFPSLQRLDEFYKAAYAAGQASQEMELEAMRDELKTNVLRLASELAECKNKHKSQSLFIQG